MQATNSLSNSFRALASKIHPQLPLTPRESSQLLGILTTSFNKQLDLHHPTALTKATPSSPHTPSRLAPLCQLSAAVSANDHLSSLLSSPLLSKKPSSASSSKSSFEAITAPFHLQGQLRWLEDKIATASVTIDDFAVILRNIRTALASHPGTTIKAIKDSSAGSKILRWIRTSGRTSEKDIMSSGSLKGPRVSTFVRNTLIDILVIQGRQDSVWYWLNYTRHIPKKSIFSRLLFSEIQFGFGIEAAMVAFLDAPSRGYSGHRSAAPIISHYLSAASPTASPDVFLRFLDTLRTQPENSFPFAVMSLFHPGGSSFNEGMVYVTAQLNKAMATGQIDVSPTLRRPHVAFYLKLARTLLSVSQTENAALVLRVAQQYFPRELGIEEKQLELESTISESASKSSTSEKENLQQLELFAT